MMRYFFTVLLLFTSQFTLADTPFQVRRDFVKVYTSPDFKTVEPSVEYFYGDTLSVKHHNAEWAEISLHDGNSGYVKMENLLQATDGFGKLSVEDKIAAPLYNITSATIVFRKPTNSSERVTLPFRKHQILYDAVPVDDDWMMIPIGGGEVGYVRKIYLNEISQDEKAEMFGQQSEPRMEDEPATGKLAPYVDGIKTGRMFILVVIAVCVLLLAQSVYRMNRGPLKGKPLGLYAHTLLVMSLLEIWYFFSLGMSEVYWFLSFDDILRTGLYVAIMLLFTWIQLSAGLNLITDTVKASVRKRRKYLWIAMGVVIGVVLSNLYRSAMGMHITGYYYRFGPDTVIFQILGQLPAGILFARNLKKRLQEKKILFCIYYMVIAGSVVSLIMGSILIFIVFAAFVALAVFNPQQEEETNEPKINPECRSCRFFIWSHESCSLRRDVMEQSCSAYKD